MSAAKCHECGTPVSHETGFSMTGGLGDNSQDRLWCPEHAPNRGRGYTLTDFERMKAENALARDERHMKLMESLGPDVYFHVLGAPPNPDGTQGEPT